MAYKIGDLYWKLSADSTQLNSELRKADVQAGNTGKSFGKMGASGKAGVAALVIAVVVGIGKISKELVKAASEAEETQNKFSVTFSTIEDSANKAASRLSDNFGLSSQAAQQLLSDTGDLLTGFGFTQSSALELSSQVNELAVDLASFTNFSGGAEGASAALTKALLGERESIKSLGIAISEADIKQLAEDKGITGEIDRQTKAALTLELAIQQSQNAIGDFNRSQDSFANKLRVAQAASSDLQVELGRALLPTATAGVTIFGNLVGKLAEVIQKENDLKDALKAREEGTTTRDQEIILITDEIKQLDELIRVYDEFPLSPYGLTEQEYKDIKAKQDADRARRDALLQQRRGLYLLGIATDEQTKKDQELIAAQNAAAEAEEERRKKIKEYLDLVAKEYAKTTEGQIAGLRAEIAQWEEYLKTAVKTKDEIEAILRLKNEQLQQLLDETDAVQELQDAYDKELEILLKKNELGLLSEEEFADSRFNLERDYIDKLLDLNDESLSGYQAFLDARLQASKETQDKELTSWEIFQGKLNDVISDVSPFISAAQSILSSVSSLLNTFTNNQIDALERQKDALLEFYGLAEDEAENRFTNERQLAEQSLENLKRNLAEANTIEERNEALKALGEKQAELDELIRKEALEEQKLRIEEEYKKKVAQLEYEAALYTWGLNSLSAAASAALAILNALATLGPIGAAIASAAAGLQVAAVLASKPTLPSYQVGAWSINGDQIAQLHDDEMVVPKPFAQSLRENISGLSGGGGTMINFEVYTTGDSTASIEESTNEDITTYKVFTKSTVKEMFNDGEMDKVITKRFTTSVKGIA